MMFAFFSRPTRALGVLASVSALGLAFSGANCASNSSNSAGPSCLANPTQCPPGETCWPTSATTFGCLTSQPAGTAGASCVEEYNNATCADGMLCDATDPNGTGQCAQYCSQAAACPTGYSCRSTQVGTGGLTVDICRVAVATTPGDGGVTVFDEGGLEDIDPLLYSDAVVDTGAVQQ